MGTKIKDPSTYHITLLYAPEGYGEKQANAFMQKMSAVRWEFGVRVTDVQEFSPGDADDKDRPVVLTLSGALLQLAAESARAEAERAFGIKVSKFDGGYKAHITVAVVPAGTPPIEDYIADLPGADAHLGYPLKFETEPDLIELHSEYDRRREENA